MTEALRDYLDKSKEIRNEIVKNARKLYDDQQLNNKSKSLTPRTSRSTERVGSGKISIIIKKILETDSSQDAHTHTLFSINELPPEKLRSENKSVKRPDSSLNKPIKLPYVKINHPRRIVSRTKLRQIQNEHRNSYVETSSPSPTSEQESIQMHKNLNKSLDLSGSKGSKSNNLRIKTCYKATKSGESIESSRKDIVSKSYNSLSPSSISENEELRSSSKNGSYLPSLRERLRRDYGVAPVIQRKIKPEEVNISTLLTHQRAIRTEKAVSANGSNSSRNEVDCLNLSSVISKRCPSLKPDSSDLQL